MDVSIVIETIPEIICGVEKYKWAIFKENENYKVAVFTGYKSSIEDCFRAAKLWLDLYGDVVRKEK